MEAIIFIGIQATGKSTFFQQRFFNRHVRINLDMLRTRNRLLLSAHAAFDCRISQLPNAELVKDYFRWRNEDAHRNALNGHCYWTLRSEGLSVAAATKRLEGMSVAEKNELLFQHGVNFNDAPNWQKRGIGLYWEVYDKQAVNPQTGEEVVARRRRIKVDYELPMKDEYGAFIWRLIENSVESE